MLALGAVPARAENLPARLSDEFSVARWAHATERAKVKAAPAGRSRTITRLRYRTEDDRPEVYLALRSHVAEDGTTWIKIRLPRRPNGTTGWVQRRSLARLNVVRTHLRINRGRRRAVLYRNGRRIWSAPVGVGKPGTPTPAGRFYIRERLRGSELGTIYGPIAFGTSAYSRLTDWPGGGVIGIHGTNRPGLIPGRPSHGCVRVRNRDIRRLARLMPVGTTVRII